MKTIQFNDRVTGGAIDIAYSDYGIGRPIVLIHGWPLSREMWEYQVADLVNAGNRVVKYDRRGFGHSSKPWAPYDYDTLADDLNELMEQLDLKDAVLAGFSMGGGEAVRYLSKYGSSRVTGLVLIGAVTPYFLKTNDNSEGVEQSVFDEMITGIQADRIGFLEDFSKKFFGFGFLHKPVSTPLLNYYLGLAAKAPQHSTLACIKSFSATDFRKDVAGIKVPTLIIHGDSDEIVPLEVSGKRTSEMIPHAELAIYDGAPHGLFYTHRHQLNHDLLNFMKGLKLQPWERDAEGIPEHTFIMP